MPNKTIAAVYIQENGKTWAVYHDCPELVAKAKAWQAEAREMPTQGSMNYWWNQDPERFNRRRFG